MLNSDDGIGLEEFRGHIAHADDLVGAIVLLHAVATCNAQIMAAWNNTKPKNK